MAKVYVFILAVFWSVVCALSVPTSMAQNATVLYNFTGGRDGAYPDGRLLLDKKGNLYGTSDGGGKAGCNPPTGCGTVFELKSISGAWTERVLHAFSGRS